MDLKLATETIQSNLEEIDRLEIELKDVSLEIPQLDKFDDDTIKLYLIEQEIYPDNEDFEYYKTQILTNYQKRQELLNNIEYYKTLNLSLHKLILFYESELRDTTENELNELLKNSGIQENIQRSIDFINSNIL